jgi:sensor c-di-GMP phosphodiesterase-like protein
MDKLKRWKLITGAVLLALAAASVPPATLYVMSRNRAVQTEQKHLTDYAQWTIERTQKTMTDVTAALKDIERQGFHDCSPEHIAAMRYSVMAHRTVGEMGFYQGNQLTCTSWGKTDAAILRRTVNYTTSGGIGIHMHVKPKVSHSNFVVGMEYGNHNALVDPAFMVDVLVDNEMGLALANGKGQVISTLNNPDPALIRQAIQTAGPGQRNNMLFSSYRTPDWIAVAVEKASYTDNDFRRQRTYLLPLGLFLAALVFLAVFWALRRRLSPLAELQIAVRKREFIAHYQPIVDLKTGRCVGAEALCRWKRPDGSMIAPNLFIPLAEQSELICPITDQIMRRVTDDMQELLQQDTGCHISINLCAHDAESGRPLSYLENLLRERNIDADRIWLETTERVFIHPDMARNALTRARNSGHTIAVDDFGTGYSSLSVLHSLPLDVLKIDKSFVDAIGSDSASARVVPHIIDMANELQLSIIAEGIEEESQAEFCRQHGVACGQGWLFGKPMEPKAFIRYFKENIATHESPQDTAVV